MFLFPVLIIAFGEVDENISKSAYDNTCAVFWGMVFGMTMMLLTIFSYNFKYLPGKKRSIKKFEKLFEQIDADSRKEYFMRVKYDLRKNEEGIILQIYHEDIKIEKKDEYPKEYLNRLDKAFERKENIYFYQNYEEKQIIMLIEDELTKISSEREDLLKEGWSIAYKLCDDKEKQKVGKVTIN